MVIFWPSINIKVPPFERFYSFFGPEIDLLIKFPEQEILWSPFENKASVATKKS